MGTGHKSPQERAPWPQEGATTVPLLPGSPSAHPGCPPAARKAPAAGHGLRSYRERKVLVDKHPRGLPRGEQPKPGLSWISPTAPPARGLAPTTCPTCAVGPMVGAGGRSQPAGAGSGCKGCASSTSSSSLSAEGSVWDPPPCSNPEGPASSGSDPPRPLPGPLALPGPGSSQK